jgi:hypothetical protein
MSFEDARFRFIERVRAQSSFSPRATNLETIDLLAELEVMMPSR